MKLTELYTKKDTNDKNDEIHPEGAHRYFVKHVKTGSFTGRFELIDTLSNNEAPIKTLQYNSIEESKSHLSKIVKEMEILNSADVMESENKDLSELQPEIINDLQKNIRAGAKDLKQKWANALELVHKAYEVGYQETTVNSEGKKEKINKPVERPTPQMKAAWGQYEELIKYAVEQLAKSRGLKDDWRMSSSKGTD